MRSDNQVTLKDRAAIAVFALIAYLPFLGAVPLFDWDEINFAESAREMLVSGNYFQVQINFEPFWEKPPLFIWLQALSMRIFGVGEFGARLPNALVGMFTLLSLYGSGLRLRDRRFAWTLVGLYLSSFLPFVYFKSGIIDPLFNLLIFQGLMQILRYEMGEEGGKEKLAPIWAGIWLGLATLTKGPVALLVSAMVYLTWKLLWDRKRFRIKPLIVFLSIYTAVILTWFGSILLLAVDGPEIIGKFIVYQAELFSQAVAGHEQPFFYHFLVFVLGCFPLSSFVFRGMTSSADGENPMVRRLMLVWFWVVLILFSIVRTKIVHYSSMLYFPGVFLAAIHLDRLWKEGRVPRWDTYLVYAFGLLIFGGVATAIVIISTELETLQAYMTNSFAREALELNVAWTGFEFVPGLFLSLGAIVGLWLMHHGKYKLFLATMSLSNLLFINGLNALVLPRIADYSQNTAIRFFEQRAQEDCYVLVQGYKTYAHYFYGKFDPFPYSEIPKDDREGWMANGPVDKPVYLVIRSDKATAEMESWFSNFEPIRREGGFCFYLRKDAPQPQP